MSTACPGRDYSAITTTINIPTGGSSGTASIPILGDTRDELAESFTVNLFGASGGLLTATSLQVTIRDDDGGSFGTSNDVLLIGGDGNDTMTRASGYDTVVVNGSAAANTFGAGRCRSGCSRYRRSEHDCGLGHNTGRGHQREHRQ